MKLASSKGYILVEASSMSALERNVQNAIKFGYVPQGGICAYGMTLVQAMILEVAE